MSERFKFEAYLVVARVTFKMYCYKCHGANLLKAGVVVLLLIVATLGDGVQQVAVKNGIILDEFADLRRPFL